MMARPNCRHLPTKLYAAVMDDEARFDDRLRKIVKHKPVEMPEWAI